MALRDTTDTEELIMNWIHDKRDAKTINLDRIEGELMDEFNLSQPYAKVIFEIWLNNANDAGNYSDIIVK